MSNNLPEFKSGVSRRWVKQFAKTFAKATRLQNALSRVAVPGMSAEEHNAFLDAKDDALDALDELGEMQVKMIAEVVIDVPADWLEDDAPDDLDWSDPESYDYLTQSKYNELATMLIDGSAFREKAKN